MSEELDEVTGPKQCCNKCVCVDIHSSVPPVELE